MVELKHIFSPFVILTIVFEIVMMIIYGTWIEYDTEYTPGETEDPQVANTYKFYSDVAVMILIGFGYLMTFLKKYGYSAAGFTFFISCLTFQWAIVTNAFFHQVYTSFGKFAIEIPSIVEGMYATAAVLITFGAILGKTTPLQLIIVAFFEMIFYSLNIYVNIYQLKAIDVGGSMIIHAFGAFFGISLTRVLTSKLQTKSHNDSGSVYTSDIFSLIGTIWLWLYWPSFNGALAMPGAQFRAFMNTFLSLTASVLTTFFVSHILRGGKFDMVDIQNATLAGGVAVGTTADLFIYPVGALSCGVAGGLVSTLGFAYFAPKIEKFFGVQDTCGVQFLHGWPGIVGGLAGVIATKIANEHPSRYLAERSFHAFFHRGGDQPEIQLAALGITLGIAIFGGLFTGFILKLGTQNALNPFNDSEFWEVPQEFGKEPQQDSFPDPSDSKWVDYNPSDGEQMI
ncbi:rh50 isoform b [Anaeramoeba ignava]|uniref:Rh50 isoform b n=1 Tax=Anaeramoeba ignava TaxID=1746090 RepID=A0A9Q0RBS1_ANAIG|nr:rh50 isoform b [Anaeramoeba ignava]|eukprot:Anaeramoba_ignava/a351165_227.p1 GENE.a351165_227~~a351165_227.p1  ORF type:complete len:454 (+),score=101.83 a351165_227:56-1417(+)